MSDKKHQKSIEELCRSRLSRTAGGDMSWPALSQKSSHSMVPRSPSPRESFSRSRRRPDTTRHSLFSSRPLSTELIPRGCPKQSVHETVAEKRKMYHGGQEATKKPFFPGIPPQVVTHAEPPFPATDTQPLPPINMPRGQEYASNTIKHGKDNKPFTIYGQMPFENGAVYDITFGTSEERVCKRKLEAIKRVEEQGRLRAYSVSRQQKESECRGKKKFCGTKRVKKTSRKFTKPLAWKSPWPDHEAADSDMDTDWTDIN